MSTWRALSLATALVIAMPALAARADDAEQAHFHDARARAHYAAGRYEQAIREFFYEQRLAPNPRVQFNIALCFDQLHRDDEAYLYFREYLAASDDDGARRAQAQTAIGRLEPRVARVAITSDPPGATIYVDERDHGSYGTTPRVLVLPPGAHTLTLSLDGHAPQTLSVEAVRGSEVTREARLVRITGTLELVASHDGDVVVRDAGGTSVFEGRVASSAPLHAALAPGDYAIELVAAGHAPWRGLVRVVAESVAHSDATLVPLPEPTVDLTVTASASGALVAIDGEPAGFAPTVIGGMRAGTHHVSVEHPGLMPWSGDVSLTEDTRGWLTVALVPPAETIRSPVTWIAGGAGLASLVVGAVLGGLALASHDRFVTLERQQMQFAMDMGAEPAGSLAELRDQQLTLSTAADVLLSVGGATMVAAIVLFFATEETESRRSDGTFSESER